MDSTTVVTGESVSLTSEVRKRRDVNQVIYRVSNNLSKKRSKAKGS